MILERWGDEKCDIGKWFLPLHPTLFSFIHSIVYAISVRAICSHRRNKNGKSDFDASNLSCAKQFHVSLSPFLPPSFLVVWLDKSLIRLRGEMESLESTIKASSDSRDCIFAIHGAMLLHPPANQINFSLFVVQSWRERKTISTISSDAGSEWCRDKNSPESCLHVNGCSDPDNFLRRFFLIKKFSVCELILPFSVNILRTCPKTKGTLKSHPCQGLRRDYVGTESLGILKFTFNICF